MKTLRKQRGLSQKELSELTGINATQLRRYESGKGNPKIETCMKIAKALDVSLLDLVPEIRAWLPATQPESEERQWIPVTERLPEAKKIVLVTRYTSFGKHRIKRNDIAYYSELFECWVTNDQHGGVEVIAWMPLPEPWKENNEV